MREDYGAQLKVQNNLIRTKELKIKYEKQTK